MMKTYYTSYDTAPEHGETGHEQARRGSFRKAVFVAVVAGVVCAAAAVGVLAVQRTTATATAVDVSAPSAATSEKTTAEVKAAPAVQTTQIKEFVDGVVGAGPIWTFQGFDIYRAPAIAGIQTLNALEAACAELGNGLKPLGNYFNKNQIDCAGRIIMIEPGDPELKVCQYNGFSGCQGRLGVFTSWDVFAGNHREYYCHDDADPQIIGRSPTGWVSVGKPLLSKQSHASTGLTPICAVAEGSDISFDPCLGYDCGFNGECKTEQGQAYCECIGGWHGDHCEHEPAPCNFIDCNHGECNDGTCQCEPYYTGEYCDVDPGEWITLEPDCVQLKIDGCFDGEERMSSITGSINADGAVYCSTGPGNCEGDAPPADFCPPAQKCGEWRGEKNNRGVLSVYKCYVDGVFHKPKYCNAHTKPELP